MARSHGTGEIDVTKLAACGDGVVIEPGALIFHPENVRLGDDVYIGHQAILKGYHRGELSIGDGSWIGQQVFMHAAGGLAIGRRVGVGPGVKIITSSHELPAGVDTPILDGALRFAAVTLGDGCDVGVGAVILPGVTLGRGAQIGAGAVVTRDVPEGAIAVGVPARVIGSR